MRHLPTRQGIVVGVDGSPSSDMAVRWATRVAMMRNLPLSLVHAVDTAPWGSLALQGGAVPLPSESKDWQKTAGEKILSAAIDLVEETSRNRTAPKFTVEVLFSAPGLALVELSRTAQLVVVGCRGQSRLARILLGSVSTGLIHHALCPVAVIHDQNTVAGQPSQLPVLVGIDGSPASELATAIAFDEASWRGVDLVALHAWSDVHGTDLANLEWSAREATASEVLSERLSGWRERYPDVIVRRRVVHDSPALHILDEAESSQLVVVGSHGRGGFPGMLLGSVSMAVAQAAPVPVIVARQQLGNQ